MLVRILGHLREQWAGVLALFLVLTGGVAYAANTVFSTDIVNDQVYSADVRNDTLAGGGLTAADLRSGSVGTSEVLDDNLAAADLRSGSVGPAEAAGLGTADIANTSSGSDNVNADKLDGLDSSGLVQGRGKVLASRFILLPDQPDRTLFEIPGLGRFSAHCEAGFRGSQINFTNTTSGAIDFWLDILGGLSHRVVPSSGVTGVANADGAEASTVALGFGDDPGARRTTTVDVFLTQAGVDQPCVFQAQAMLWTVDE